MKALKQVPAAVLSPCQWRRASFWDLKLLPRSHDVQFESAVVQFDLLRRSCCLRKKREKRLQIVANLFLNTGIVAVALLPETQAVRERKNDSCLVSSASSSHLQLETFPFFLKSLFVLSEADFLFIVDICGDAVSRSQRLSV